MHERVDGNPAATATGGGTPAALADHAEERRVARSLASAIDRALDLGELDHAGRIGRSAEHLAPRHPAVAERLARLHLTRGDAEAALSTIDACSMMPSSLRLLRTGCLMHLGRKPEAHLDLHLWSRLATAPHNARVLLALLELEAGDAAAARAALARHRCSFDDVRAVATRMLAALHAPDHESAGGEAAAMAVPAETWTTSRDEAAALRLMRRSLGLPAATPAAAPSAAEADRLALELLACEAAVPVIVDWLQSRPGDARTVLVARALEAALPHVADRMAVIEALTRLALVRGDWKQAQQWLRRGLEHRPMSASLARLKAEMARAEPQAAGHAGRREPSARRRGRAA
jgi:hypothetical protein